METERVECCEVCGGREFQIIVMRKPGCQDPTLDMIYGEQVNECTCGLVFLNPRLTEESLREFYRKHYEDFLQQTGRDIGSMQQHRNVAHMRFERIRGYLKRPCNVLEIGCGTGHFLRECAKVGCEVTGTELRPEKIKIARGQGLNILDTGDIPSGPFDFAAAIHVLEHVRHPLEFLKELRSVAPRAYVEVPRFRPQHITPHLYDFRPKVLWALIKKAGWQVLEEICYDSKSHWLGVTLEHE